MLDTQVALDLLHFRDPRTVPLRAALQRGRARWLSDEACRAEWRRVLDYPALGLEPVAIERLRAAYDAQVDWIAPGPAPDLPRCLDPDDQKFLELAARAGAHMLLTRDAALLRLARRCARDAGFRILAPADVAPGCDATC